MAHKVVLGAGLAGSFFWLMKRPSRSGAGDRITVVTQDRACHFVPSNPRIAVDWRKREDITVDLAATMARKAIALLPVATEKLMPEENG